MCLGVPGRLISAEGEGFSRVGKVDFEGIAREVNLAYVPEANPGDYVVVHVGFAISMLNEDEAKQTLSLLRELAAAGAADAGPEP